MTRLVAALEALGLHGDVASGGHWVALQGERCTVFVVEAHWGSGYYAWCDDPGERIVRHYDDPTTAIRAGLRRAARHGPPELSEGQARASSRAEQAGDPSQEKEEGE